MRKNDIPLEKITLNMFVGDAARLRDLYRRQGGASFIVRNLVRQFLRKIDEDTAQVAPAITIQLKQEEFE